MSEAVQLAWIALLSKGWSDFVALMTSQTALTITGFLVIMTKQWWDGRQAKEAVKAAKGAQTVALEAREELAAKIDQNTQLTAEVKDKAERSHAEVTSAFMAGKREGYVGGIAEGKKQASGPVPLGK